MSDALTKLTQAGVSIWLDDLSRERLKSGNLAQLLTTKQVVGVTTNPTIFASALAKGDAYTDQVKELAAQGKDVDDAVFAITTDDVREACDVLDGVYQSTAHLDGRVSIEVEPGFANDTEKTVKTAKLLWATVDRPNAMIKIPATKPGLPAITSTLAEGISVNVTLIFDIGRYREVMDAYLSGLEQAKENGHDIGDIASVASFFVSRVDTEIDKRLDAIGTDEAKALKGQAGIANAVLAYQAYEEVFSSARWEALAAAGAKPQRPLWASTGVKNPDYSDTMYVDQLAAPGIVNTMPEATLDAVADHGNVTDTVQSHYADAQATFDQLTAAGIDIAEVGEVLENEGVEKFNKSWEELLVTVGDELERQGAKDTEGQ